MTILSVFGRLGWSEGELIVDIKHILGLLVRQNGLYKKVLALTKDVGLTEDTSNMEAMEAESGRFVGLYQEREALVKELSALHEEIGEEGYALVMKAGERAVKLYNESQDILRQIMALDERYRVTGQALMTKTREDVRRIKQGRSVSLKYSGDWDDPEMSRINSKN